MEKKRGNQTVGIILVLAGMYWACKSLGMFHFSIFFDGWWTLFLIVPCLIGFLKRKSRGTNLAGLIFGVMLLLWRQGLMSGSYIPAIFLAAVFILIGISIMMKETKHMDHQKSPEQEYAYHPGRNAEENMYQESASGQQNTRYQESASYDAEESTAQQKTYESSFSESSQDSDKTSYSNDRSNYETCPPNISAFLVGKSVSCLNGLFHGTSVQSVLGNVQLDLRQAKLERDVFVNVNLILGGADIYLPEQVRVICDTQSILGDVRDARIASRNQDPMAPAIHIVGNCILGGLELK